jgi:hypothetical protein
VHVNGADVDLNPIQPGLAWHDKRYEREQSRRTGWPTLAPKRKPARSGVASGANGASVTPLAREASKPSGPCKSRNRLGRSPPPLSHAPAALGARGGAPLPAPVGYFVTFWTLSCAV